MYVRKAFQRAVGKVRTIGQGRKSKAVILMYHQIANVSVQPNWLAVSPENFAQHLEHIRQTCQPFELDDLVESVMSGVIPDRAVAVTFDDGYCNNFTQALPLLDHEQIPATVFVTAGFIDKQQEFWWDELSRFLLLVDQVPATLSLTIQGRHYTWETATRGQRRTAFSSIKELIKPLPAIEQNNVLNSLSAWANSKRVLRPDFRVMTTAELKQLAGNDFIDIGAHTMTHPILPTLSEDEQYEEIGNSRRTLESMLKRPVTAFSYPNGDFSDDTVSIVQEVGFKAAFTTQCGPLGRVDDLYRLQRCPVNDWDIETFRQNLNDFFQN